jgi:Ca2+-binding EF-hand superfamily protein
MRHFQTNCCLINSDLDADDLEERREALQNVFKAADKDNNSFLDQSEWSDLLRLALTADKMKLPARIEAKLMEKAAPGQEAAAKAKARVLTTGMMSTFDDLIQNSGGMAEFLFKELDKNGDGKVLSQQLIGYVTQSSCLSHSMRLVCRVVFSFSGVAE